MDPGVRMALGAVVAAYLIYLGYGLIKSYLNGEQGMPGWMAVLFGLLFIACGGGYLFYQYKQYMVNKKQQEEEERLYAEEAESAPEEEDPEEDDDDR